MISASAAFSYEEIMEFTSEIHSYTPYGRHSLHSVTFRVLLIGIPLLDF